MTYDILATGSTGNAVVINGEILIDCGVPYKTLEQSRYIKSLRLVLLTHEHGDHFKPSTARRLHLERPALRWGCCEWMKPHLLKSGVNGRAIDEYQCGEIVNYGSDLALMPDEVPHDVRNCCYSLFIGSEPELLFYCTDCGSIDHISAKNYDLYLIEANHTKAEIEARIEEKLAAGEFAYEYRAARNHLSQEQAVDWLAENAGPNSEYIFLHQHKQAAGC